MEIWIKISTDNDAFEDTPNQEISRILEKMADNFSTRIELKDRANFKILDVNGNFCGYLSIYKEPHALIKESDLEG